MGKLASAPANQIAAFRSDGVTASTGLRIQFFTDAFSRAFGLPDVHLVNQISEATPLREERPYVPVVGLREVHYSRPGMVAAYTLGAGPIRGLTVAPPIYGGGIVTVSGLAAYAAGGANLGTIPGRDLVRFAQSRSQLVMAAAGSAWLFDGSAFNQVVSSALPPVSDVTYLAGRFVYTCQGSDTFYYSAINDAGNIDGLAFATAESNPDPTVAVGILNEQLVFFGAASVEFWQTAGDANAPFQPIVGRGFQRGCAARGSVTFADNALFWVGDNRVVYRVGSSAPLRISSSSIEDKLRQCNAISQVTAWAATFEGHELYVLNIPGIGTYAYDCSRIGLREADRGEWAEWRSWGHDTFPGQVATVLNDVTYVGDDTTGTIWTMQAGVYQDGTAPLTRQASAFIKVEEGTPRCNNLVLHGVMGVGGAVDPGANPIVEMRWSDDQGRTFADWRPASLGRAGQYTTRAFWQRLGCMRAPGRLVEIRCSDPVNVVFSHLELNAVRPST